MADATEFYSTIYDLFADAHKPDGATALLTYARPAWSEALSSPWTPESAEASRLAMLAAVHLEDYSEARLWKVRAMSGFTSVGWHEGIGALLMSEAFGELASANADFQNGKAIDAIRPSSYAIEIMREVVRFAGHPSSGIRLKPGSPTTQVLTRLVYEKLGFLELLDGRFQDSRASYRRALTEAGDHSRGRIKVQLGLALLDYLADSKDRDKGSQAEQTAALGSAAREAGIRDLADIAECNAAVMRSGDHALQPYEIL